MQLHALRSGGVADQRTESFAQIVRDKCSLVRVCRAKSEVWEAGRMDPVRTCVACRSRVPREELLRIVLREGRLIPDDRAVLHGRGAWVHPTVECLKQAMSRSAVQRALRASGETDAGPLENRLETLMDN